MADLIYEVHNHLARITLNRPKQLNCFSEEMIRLWTEALEDVRDNDDVYALLLSGNGKAFCAARTLKGKEAADMGLVTHCVPDAELDTFVEQYMEKLLAAPQQAMRLTKRAVVQGEQSSLRASLDLISSFMGIVTELDDYRQRTSALVAKMQRKAQ